MEYIDSVIALGLIYGIAAICENISFGFSGQLSIAQAAFFVLGAYGYALSTQHGHGIFVSTVIGMLAAAGAGAVLSFVGRDLRGDFFLIFTLAFQVIISEAATNIQAVGGATGLFAIRPYEVFGFTPQSYAGWLLVLVPITVLVWAVTTALGASRFGLVLKAIRRDEDAVATLGRRPTAYKVAAMSYSAAGTALGGAIFAGYITAIDPVQFTFQFSVLIVSMLIVGGVANPLGPIVGAVILTALPEALRHIPQMSADIQAGVIQVVYALALLVMIAARPGGLVNERPGRWSLATWRGRRRFGEHAPKVSEAELEQALRRGADHDEASIAVTDVGKRFGGVAALVDVSLEALPGRITAVIGPNGAGKTTLFNVVAGRFQPDEGRVATGDTLLSAWSSRRIAHAGISRTFQDVRVFTGMSVLENVAVGARSLDDMAEGIALLGFAGGLSGQPIPLHVGSGDLSYGQQKLVALARALAVGSHALLLDEPAAGLDAGRVDVLQRLLEQLRASGRVVVLVEHNMRLVMDVADHVVVMAEGRVLTEGLPAAIQADERVIDAYTGRPAAVKATGQEEPA